jgi:hypothetical protein
VGKKTAIILVIFFISGLVIMGYFLQQGRKKLFTDPYKAISPDACIVIETVDIKSFMNSLTTGRGLFGEVGKVKELERFNQELKYLADLLNKQNFKKLFNEGAAIISFQADNKYLSKVVADGAEKARASASKTVREVREIIGYRPF